MKKFRVLLVNDDGIHAKGLHHLWCAVKDIAECTIVAPHTQKSGASTSISLFSDIIYEQVQWQDSTNAWSITGTPADCVKIALSDLITGSFDFILSGINPGTNAGRTLFYSGTVGGIIEGVLRGIPGIAFSAVDFSTTDYSSFYPYIRHSLEYIHHHPLPSGTLLNVNFPSIERKQALKGIRLARQGKQFVTDSTRIVNQKTLRYDLFLKSFDEHEESDITLLEKGYITCVPVHIGEITDHSYFAEHRKKFTNLSSFFE